MVLPYLVMVAEAGNEIRGFEAGIISKDICERCRIGFARRRGDVTSEILKY